MDQMGLLRLNFKWKRKSEEVFIQYYTSLIKNNINIYNTTNLFNSL